MLARLFTFAIVSAATLGGLGAISDANAKCTRLGFSVNDYGKDGPIRDAKALLDKYVAKWASDNGVKNYTIGKKTVTCELFLDFGVFDEHTCRAEAPVCWGGSGGPVTAPTDATAPAGQPGDVKPASVKPASVKPASIKPATDPSPKIDPAPKASPAPKA
jgi:hypothetical protein